MAWKTLIAFSLPSVLFVILSPVNFLLFSAMPSQLSASCLHRLSSPPTLPFFFLRPCLSFLLPLAESLQERLRSNWSTVSVLFYSFYPPLCIFFFRLRLIFSALPGATLSILIFKRVGKNNGARVKHNNGGKKRRKICALALSRLCVCVLYLHCKGTWKSVTLY